MFDMHRVELDWGGRKLTLETGRVARQADGAVVVNMADTVVLVTAVGDKKDVAGRDFFPLTVNYQEKTFAAGKIPGGFFKREGRPSEKETLTSRLIDRPIRPLFPDGYRRDVQVIATVLSMNTEIDPDIPSLLGASAALSLRTATAGPALEFVLEPLALCLLVQLDFQLRRADASRHADGFLDAGTQLALRAADFS